MLCEGGTSMKMFKGIKGVIILVVLLLLVLGYYYYLSNKTKSEQDTFVESTKVQEVLMRDLEKNYPPSPKEVIKYYSDITMCFYNETYTEDELDEMAMVAWRLFDTELASNMEKEEYLVNLREDIQEYKDNDYKISSYSTTSSINIENEKFTKDGYEWTRVYCYYYLRKGTKVSEIDQVFLLRKDELGYWKIYGWELANKK